MIPFKRSLLVSVPVLVCSCATAPQATVPARALSTQGASVVATVPSSVSGGSSLRVPTQADMRQLLPAALTPAEADRELITVSPDKVLVPSSTGHRLVPSNTVQASWLGRPFGLGGYGLGRFGLGPYGPGGLGLGLGRFFPFQFGGAPFFAPYFMNPAIGMWSPFAFAGLPGRYAFMASPWLSGCGAMLPYNMNFAPAWVGAAIGTFGCGGGLPVMPWY